MMMEELFRFFESDKLWMMFTAVMSAYIAIIFVYFTLVKSRQRLKYSKVKEAYTLIIQGIEQDTLENDSDIFLIYKKLVQTYSISRSYVDFLESFLIYVRKISEDKDAMLKTLRRINPILEKEREEKPYCNVNDRERRILLTIEDAFKKNEINSIKHILVDLSMVIEGNQKALDRAKSTNKWSIPISIVGVLLTLFIWLYGSSLSERDVEKISTHVSNTILEQVYIGQIDSIRVSVMERELLE